MGVRDNVANVDNVNNVGIHGVPSASLLFFL